MSYFDPKLHYAPKFETANHIVPERLREVCILKGLSYDEAAEACDISPAEFGRMANGRQPIPPEYIFKFMSAFDYPKNYFYQIRWERV